MIFLSDVPAIEQSSPPVEWLKMFVHRYGLQFFLGEKGPFLFVTNEIVSILSANSSLMRIEKFPQQHAIDSTCNFSMSELGVAEIIVVYAIDNTEYLKDLRRHGIRTSPVPQ